MREVPYSSNGWITAALVTAGLLGVMHVAYKFDIHRALYGKGYIPWVQQEWKAKQAATRLGRPLLTLHVDPRHADKELLERLMKAPELQATIDMFVWYRVEAKAQDEPGAPYLSVRGANGEEELMDPIVVSGLTSAGLSDRLCEALAAAGYEAPGTHHRPVGAW